MTSAPGGKGSRKRTNVGSISLDARPEKIAAAIARRNEESTNEMRAKPQADNPRRRWPRILFVCSGSVFFAFENLKMMLCVGGRQNHSRRRPPCM